MHTTNPLQRVFPERNRTALEGSDQLTALQENRTTLPVTYGHVATKIFELFAERFPSADVAQIVQELFPKELHTSEIPESEKHRVLWKIDEELVALDNPSSGQLDTSIAKIERDLHPLFKTVETMPEAKITFAELRMNLQAIKFSHADAQLSPEQVQEVLEEFCCYIGRMDWLEKMCFADSAPTMEEEQILLTDIVVLPQTIADLYFKELARASEDRCNTMRAAINALVLVTSTEQKRLTKKLPIKQEN